MKKAIICIGLFALLAVPSVVAQSKTKLGAGVFGGMSMPVLQDDQGSGTEFGIKGRFGLGNIFVLEPHVTFTSWGEPGSIEDVDLDISGSSVTSFGLDASLGNYPGILGVSPYFVGGIASYKVKNDDTGYDESNIGFSGGLGIGIGLTEQFALDIRGKAVIIPQEAGSKKALAVVVGLNFTFPTSN